MNYFSHRFKYGIELHLNKSELTIHTMKKNNHIPIYSVASRIIMIIAFLFISHVQASEKKKQKPPIKKLTEIASKGDASAQLRLGKVYFSGLMGVDVDFKKAVHWFRESAGQGHAGAELKLAQCFEHGYGVEKFKNGDTYRGNYQNGKPHGYG